ncbi:hypothetical protein JW905_08250 [bacterium]|nr:hypothetical protein [candidate division CSSED10-310 bacterium]
MELRRLLVLCNDGDTSAWTELLQRYSRNIQRHIGWHLKKYRRLKVKDPGIADDLFQDALFKLYQHRFYKLVELPDDIHLMLERFLWVITRHVVVSQVRRAQAECRTGEIPFEDLESVSDLASDREPLYVFATRAAQQDPIKTIEHQQLMDQIMECINRVCAPHELERKLALQLYILNNLGAMEIIRIGGLRYSTEHLRKVISRGRKAVAICLKRKYKVKLPKIKRLESDQDNDDDAEKKKKK